MADAGKLLQAQTRDASSSTSPVTATTAARRTDLPPQVVDTAASATIHEIEQRFGVLPNFFRLASEDPDICRNLWGFARFGYLDNPLPSLFKERLFVYLSRFCEVRYCIARHVGFLLGLGRPSGDAQSAVQSVEEVVRLLRTPLPRGEQIEPPMQVCRQLDGPIRELPEPDSALEKALIACATHVFLTSGSALECRAALKHALGPQLLEHLLLFLAFVRTAHFWTKVHPELHFEPDLDHLLETHESLSQCILHDSEAETCELGEKLRDELVLLRASKELHEQTLRAHDALRANEEKLRQANDELAQRVAELQHANNELTRFNQVTVGRELRMIELKNEVNELCRLQGLPLRYSTDLAQQNGLGLA